MQPTLYAYIKNKTVFYHFIPFSHLPAVTISVPLGQGIINFIWPDSEQESTVFKIIKYLVDNYTDEKSYNNLIFNTLSPLARRSPFLFFVADAFLSYQMNLASANTISTFLNLFPNTDKYNFTDIQKDVENWLYSTKKDLDNELTYLLTEKTGENHLSPIQKLYLLSINNNSPFSHLKNLNFKTCLMPTNAYVPNSFSDALETFETENPEVIEMYCLHTFNELISFEFSQMLLHNINYKKCKCCGKYFIPTGYSNAEYCNRIAPSNQKRCKEIGAALQFKQKNQSNPIYAAYKTAYARMDSRKRSKKLTISQFNQWSFEARTMREKCENGDISFTDFENWLNQSRIN